MYDVKLTESFFRKQNGDPPDAITIGESLRRQAAERPDNLALRALDYDGDVVRDWTFAELYADAERLARALAARHPIGARIAVYANNVPEWVILEYASAMAGLVLVTVNPSYQPRELKYVLEQSRSEGVYYVEEFRGNPMGKILRDAAAGNDAIRHRIRLDDHGALFAGASDGALPETAPGDIVQIQYTSGTTGFPKGALLHHHGLVQNGLDTVARGGVRAGDMFLNPMPLFHTTGCAILALGGLGSGAAMVLPPMFDPMMAVRVIEREKLKFLLGVPTMIVAMIDAVEKTGADVSSVRHIMSGGSMVAPELVRKANEVFGAMIQIVYGQTECSPVITEAWADDAADDLSHTVGQPLPHMDVSIRDPQTNDVCAVDAQGEICTRGYHVMIGYNDNPEATAAAIDKDGWLHTGDLGRMDERGYVKVTGRVKEMIIRGGENLFPAEIENAMLEHDDIAEVAVVGIPDEKWGEVVACFMRCGGDARPDAAALKGFIRERLSPQKTPTIWVYVEEWPLTGSGKIQKFKLREGFEAGAYSAI